MSISPSSSSLAGVIRTCMRPVAAPKTRPQPRQLSQHQQPSFSTTARVSQESDVDRTHVPRWQQTPPAMAMPVRTRRAPQQPPFLVNKDPAVLDNVYRKLLGKDGHEMLPEELKWLAVTHKSFDHARRGFNDRLAYLGKRIVDLQCSLALLNAPQMLGDATSSHTALKGLDNVTSVAKAETLNKFRLAQVAQSYGLEKVVRWKPRKADDLKTSGVDVVLAHTLYSIVGAIALHRGGEAANRVAKEKILNPLGLR